MGPDCIAGAVLLAAGLGTRLRPLTDVLPKCLAPIRGRPLLDFWLAALAGAGVRPIVVNTHYRSELVEEYIAQSPWSKDVVVARERSLLGTGGTLLANASRFGAGPLLIAHADNLSLFDLDAFVAAHAERPAAAVMTVMTFTTDHPESCGIVSVDERGLIDGFHEKVATPPGNRANGAVYIVEREVIDFVRGLGKPVVDLSTEVLPHFVGRMTAWHNSTYHRDIGSVESWRAAQNDFPEPPPKAPADDRWAHILERAGPEARTEVARLLGEGVGC